MRKSHRTLPWPAGIGILAFSLGVAFAHPAGAASPKSPLKLGYEVYLGGLNIFYFDADLAFDGDRYVISGGGKTKGLARLMWRWAVQAKASGILNGSGVESRAYNVSTLRKKKHKLMRLAFKESGAYAVERTPPDSPRKRKRRNLPKAVPHGTLDPISVSLAVAGALARGGSCGGKFPIFDGNRRYDLTFKKVGQEYLAKPGYSTFSGQAIRCQFAMDRISGFRKRQRVVLRFWDDEETQLPQVWMARLKSGLPMVPVQFQAEFNMGYMIIYLSKAEYGGRPLLEAQRRATK
ncbi:MAG: DUF3108 domain-containing protein [Alphaproteobacteria bacterium]|nr:DUF3108 domain-containing protein [Alphaproteobacteria bacterium]